MGLGLRSFPSPGVPSSIPTARTRRRRATRGGQRAHGDKQQPQRGCLLATSTEGFGSQNLVLANGAIAADGAALLRPAGNQQHEDSAHVPSCSESVSASDHACVR